MTINRYTLYQAFKYSLYAFLTLNVYWFFAEELDKLKDRKSNEFLELLL